ncbi:hypothetical protein ABH920_006076 [Catenulispora sp. EB89]|uniref:DUF7919 family protein n=1 Tax=Catenulispora sp. EB89 TaxID=3156257 RepID=UPI003519942F
MYFPDLSPYGYRRGLDSIPMPAPEFSREVAVVTWRLNVGWLDDIHPHAIGPVPEETLEALQSIIAHQNVNKTRGFHKCELCPADSPSLTYVDAQGESHYLANGEIRIPAADGSLYAAPKLVGHYVEAHQYLPPAGFLSAVDDYFRASRDNLALGWIYWEQSS